MKILDGIEILTFEEWFAKLKEYAKSKYNADEKYIEHLEEFRDEWKSDFYDHGDCPLATLDEEMRIDAENQ